MKYVTINGIRVFGDIQQNAVDQATNLISPHSTEIQLMADHHLGYSMPVGGVAAFDGLVSPSCVGFDIGCGNQADCLDISGDDAQSNIKDIMDTIVERISFGVGRTNSTQVIGDHHWSWLHGHDEAWDICEEISVHKNKPRGFLKQNAIQQFGTIGSGNHYVDIFNGSDGQAWVGVHFGSRGLGHSIASYFISKGGGADGINAQPVMFSDTSVLGMQYIKCMQLAGAYAHFARNWVCEEVGRVIGTETIYSVRNHHNYAWFEGGRWVIRKGATPAFPGQKGFIGGSMGENSVIVAGTKFSGESMFSTVHGAGRVMSRTEAKGKIHRKTGEIKTTGLVSQEMMDEWVGKAGVELRGGGVDESPHCYKRLNEVLEAQGRTIEILETLKPIGVAMAGGGTVDPWKD